ncbi:hypothetical protein MHBO_001769, partial [Bonamia ostreae]
MNDVVTGVSLSYFDEYLRDLKRAECISTECIEHRFFTQFGENQFPELHITAQSGNLVVTSLRDKYLTLHSIDVRNLRDKNISSLIISENNKSIMMTIVRAKSEQLQQFNEIRLGTEHLHKFYVSYLDWEPQNFVDRGQNVRTFHFPVLPEMFDPEFTTQFGYKIAKFGKNVESFMSRFPMTKFGLNADEASSLHLIPSTSANPPD